MTRVLVVDDSALMRRHLAQLLQQQPGFEVRTARNGAEALELVEAFDPQVVTLDVNMPEMDGITCLSRIMVGSPRAVIMVSSITAAGAETTLQALSLGALDFVQKPGGTISLSLDEIAAQLVAKVKVAAGARVRGRAGVVKPPPSAPAPPPARMMKDGTTEPGLVILGVSTGGPSVLETILPALPATLPWPVLVAQHMPSSFTGVFARRLDALCAIPVQEVRAPTPLLGGNVYIARGDADMIVARRGGVLTAMSVPASEQHAWHPSVTRLVESAAEHVPADRLIGVQLTGMGDDGAEAMARCHRRGMRTIAQDADSSAVFGMPYELIRRAGANLVLASDAIAGQIAIWLASNRRAHAS
ncbi:chemotaxis protein CheY [Sphingomonas taxi]|uniref:Protein-glutamate methylesterase/protein-glutamine glutaminase n=1 Tax=Sphingomonas taxi TaxID=1549858 RepID=A0A097EFK9_9SPHN|nr:chemotaxis-specific protein-glutamate methyltransferase CheB [Sphingomonas taxi]AIT06355.1 chemotaxis protein CheY [Sphingomonas taxi]